MYLQFCPLATAKVYVIPFVFDLNTKDDQASIVVVVTPLTAIMKDQV